MGSGGIDGSEKGFTLIEIAAVIFILGLALSFVLPRLMSLEAVELKSTARRLSGTVRYLMDQAAFSKTLYLLMFDLKGEEHKYWVRYCLPERDPPYHLKCWDDRAILGKKIALPGGIRFQDIVLMGEKIPPDTEGGVCIPFFPDGYVPPSSIHLHDRRDKSYTLQINPVTGRVKIVDGYVEAKAQSTSQIRP